MSFGGHFRLKSPKSVFIGLSTPCQAVYMAVAVLMINKLVPVGSAPVLQKFHDPNIGQYGETVSCTDLKCGPGTEATLCNKTHPASGTCKDCDSDHWQADWTSRFDHYTCRLKTTCPQHGFIAKNGSKTIDRTCGCNGGYYLAGTHCLPFTKCGKGFGQTKNGVCEQCFPKGAYSDVADKYQPCKMLKTCAGCIYEDSHGGTQDRHCGRLIGGKCVKSGKSARTTSLPTLQTTTNSQLTPTKLANNSDQAGLYIGLAVGLVVLVVFIIIVSVLAYRSRTKARTRKSPTSSHVPLLYVPAGYEQILQRAEESEPYAKKIWELCIAKIPGNLGHKRRALARELYGQDFLGKRTAFLDNFEFDYERLHEHEKAIKLLNDWRSNMGPEAILSTLFAALNNNCLAALEQIIEAAPSAELDQIAGSQASTITDEGFSSRSTMISRRETVVRDSGPVSTRCTLDRCLHT